MYYRLVKMAAETECFKLRFSHFKPGTLISDVKRVCVRPFNYFLITKGETLEAGLTILFSPNRNWRRGRSLPSL